MKTTVTYIISNINKAFAFEWIAESINKDKFNLQFILLNSGDSNLENYLKKNNFPVKRITYSGKKDIPKAIFIIFKTLLKNKSTVVHTHLFDANIVGLTAAKLAGVKKRIHTRHHSDYHHQYFSRAVKYDRYVNWISTDIVAISEVVKQILIEKEKVKKHKIHLIHHGFELAKFSEVRQSEINELKKKYNPSDSRPKIGVISRYLELKGIQYIIPAFKNLLIEKPKALLILANTEGAYTQEIRKLLTELPTESYIEINFEPNIFALYKLFDIFIHVPVAAEIEAFGQTYVEALAAEVPSIFTLSGIANEFIVDRHNALVVPYMSSDAILNAIKELLNDKKLASQIVSNGKIEVDLRFGIDKMILSLERLYE
ncbi:MAG: glycosyltransferase family 4 protein [Bacteroidota bacterium]